MRTSNSFRSLPSFSINAHRFVRRRSILLSRSRETNAYCLFTGQSSQSNSTAHSVKHVTRYTVHGTQHTASTYIAHSTQTLAQVQQDTHLHRVRETKSPLATWLRVWISMARSSTPHAYCSTCLRTTPTSPPTLASSVSSTSGSQRLRASGTRSAYTSAQTLTRSKSSVRL